VGSPGVGKTTLAQAIAEDAQTDFIMINAPFIADKYKNSGPENLKETFKEFLHRDRLTIVAFDELHALTDGNRNINDLSFFTLSGAIERTNDRYSWSSLSCLGFSISLSS